jgi:hypothetical protein
MENQNHDPPKIAELHSQVKQKFWLWKTCEPNQKSDTFSELKDLKTDFRSVQRQHSAVKRRKLYSEIMEADSSNQQLFYHLVNKQRATGQTPTNELVYKNQTHRSSEEQLAVWAKYLQDRATAMNLPNFDKSYEETLSIDMSVIDCIATIHKPKVEPFSETEVYTAMKKLKKNKAGDIYGLTSEHLLHAMNSLVPLLTHIFNAMIENSLVPTAFKLGVLIPLVKKLKTKKFPTNYRGITIISIIGKHLELSMLLRIVSTFIKAQCKLQRGFTEGIAPLYAALLLCEAINEYAELGEDLVVVLLDAEKAFDKVSHENLFNKLYHMGMPLDFWKLIREWYRGFESQVRWLGNLSSTVEIKQGTIQGGGISPHAFKADTNDVLLEVTDRHLGAVIGTDNVAIPTCADDIAAIFKANSTDGDLITSIITAHSNRDKRCNNASKSNAILYKNSSAVCPPPDLKINGDRIPNVEEAVHIGILQSSNTKVNQKRVQLCIRRATQALYATFGAGVHGRNGINPQVSAKIWRTFIIPRLTYGTELWILKRSEMDQFEKFQNTKLRQIQGLPDRTANIATTGLLGVWPVEAVIDRNAITLFTNIIRNKDSIEYQIAVRQLAVKSSKSNSWFQHINRTLQKYNLPNAHSLLENLPPKSAWSTTVSKQVKSFWQTTLYEKHSELTSTRYISTTSLKLQNTAPLWVTAKHSLRDTEKAFVKAKILTGTYRLQAHEAVFSKHRSPTCQLCKEQSEDRSHFLLNCMALAQYRKPHMALIHELLLECDSTCILHDDTLCLQLLLDASHSCLPIPIQEQEILVQLEKLSRDMIFHLHLCRWKILNTQYQKMTQMQPVTLGGPEKREK